MTHARFTFRHRAVAGMLLGLTLIGGAQAHGDAGEHVENFEQHLSIYGSNVQQLGQEIDSVTAAYADGDAVVERVDALVQQWEQVKFHAAVETVAPPLYPPIWAAIGRFESAIKEDADASVVRQRADAIQAALNQGLGGLKYAAKVGDADPAGDDGHSHADEHDHAGDSSQDPVGTIMAALDKSVSLYKQNKPGKAKELIQKTYLQRFEMLEGDLIEQDPELVSNLEQAFNATLPNLMTDGAPAGEIRAQVDAMDSKLERARVLLDQAGADDDAEVF